MICPYCGKEKPEDEFTDEHVVPRALGGALEPVNPFKLRVCGRCNSACGRWVDARFVRSWFIYNERAQAGIQHADPKANPILPLIFMGPLKKWSGPSICDFWLGPGGDNVFHFHERYPAEPSLIGRPPELRANEFDPGRVLLTFTATNQLWYPAIYQSVLEAFPAATVHTTNSGPSPDQVPWPALPPEAVAMGEFVNGRRQEQMVEVHFEIDLGFDERFAAKMALGFASLTLGEPFVLSSDAKRLRNVLWTKDRAERQKFDFRGRGTLAEGSTELAGALGWNGCHVMALHVVEGELTLTMLWYGKHAITIAITTEQPLFSHAVGSDLTDGLCWIIAPGLRAVVGPEKFGDYVAHISGGSKLKSLEALKTRLDAAPVAPAFHLPKA